VETKAEALRTWQGPALLSFGFRPFFLLGAIWAALSMALWLAMLTGTATLPIRLDPVSWHAHEFLYGYLGAIVAGFLLTAVPNWTERLPFNGWPLAGLVALWLLGRLAMATSAFWPPEAVALIDLLFPITFAVVIGREIITGKNWRNLFVLVLFGALVTGNAVFHWEAAHGGYAAQGVGLRIGVATAIMLIALIGGRIVPSFTRNWLAKQDEGRLPAPPMGRFDRAALLVLLGALGIWVVWPASPVTGVLLLVAGGFHFIRLARWAGDRATAEPLVWVLHVGYAFVPLGAVVISLAILFPQIIRVNSAQHLWMAGAIGLMTLAVMTRATLGHTGQALTAGAGTTGIYVLMMIAVFARLSAGAFPALSASLQMVSGLAWLAAFCGFTLLYGRLLILPRNSA